MKVDLYKFNDLLEFAQDIGYNLENAHKILVDNEVPPMYERKTCEYHINELDYFNFCKDTKKILTGFMNKENLTWFVLV